MFGCCQMVKLCRWMERELVIGVNFICLSAGTCKIACVCEYSVPAIDLPLPNSSFLFHLPTFSSPSLDSHLGHNLPDRNGSRYCINLVSVAGRPVEGGGRKGNGDGDEL